MGTKMNIGRHRGTIDECPSILSQLRTATISESRPCSAKDWTTSAPFSKVATSRFERGDTGNAPSPA
eukprot:scaffold207977_cov35-Tisochrysis_lutea.AAC.2